jgi:hypothetical protein
MTAQIAMADRRRDPPRGVDERCSVIATRPERGSECACLHGRDGDASLPSAVQPIPPDAASADRPMEAPTRAVLR